MKVSWWSVGYWLALVGAGILIIWIAVDRQTLSSELASKRKELGQVEVELRLTTREREQARQDIGTIRASALSLVASMNASQRFLFDLELRLRGLCDISGDNVGDLITFCADVQRRVSWLRLSSPAVLQRAVAMTSDEFGPVADAYARLASEIGADRARMAFVREGIAYARLRQHRLDDASAAIRQAQEADGSYILAGITALKIECEQQIGGPHIRSSLNRLRARADAAIERLRRPVQRYPALDLELDYARAERRLIEQDLELYLLCEDARIRPEAHGRRGADADQSDRRSAQ